MPNNLEDEDSEGCYVEKDLTPSPEDFEMQMKNICKPTLRASLTSARGVQAESRKVHTTASASVDFQLQRIEELLLNHMEQDTERSELFRKTIVKLLQKQTRMLTEGDCEAKRKLDHPKGEPLQKKINTWLGLIIQLGIVCSLLWLVFRFATQAAIAPTPMLFPVPTAYQPSRPDAAAPVFAPAPAPTTRPKRTLR